MMKKHLYILLSLVICSQLSAQNFDKLVEHFRINNIVGFEIIPRDSISENSLYKSEDFNVSISKNPINFKIDTLVLKNPYFTDDFDDWDDNYINFPKSFSVIYEENLISLFGNGKFLCHNLNDYSRNTKLENNLNSKKFKYHWVIDGKLYAKSKSFLFSGLYQWNGKKWKSADIKIPVDEQSILLSDNKFIVYRKCSGEFGGTIYFFDRQSKETYFTESTCTNTVIKKNGQYQILAHLGHMMGTSVIKIINDPKKLTKAKNNQLKIKQGSLGYQDKTKEYSKELVFYGIQLFSTFNNRERNLFLAHFNESTFLAAINGKEIQIVNPLFNNDKYTHNPITRTYGKYTLINMDFYGIAIDREVSIMIIKDNKITLLDWNENHSR
ncbi:hypothetical protein [Xanthomarina gelatinilytica]|uniref:hypothetical protein n=1 Tax=Xanthomarina gelatinilytica TaxID=1137281 RepID=UPI003AA95E18